MANKKLSSQLKNIANNSFEKITPVGDIGSGVANSLQHDLLAPSMSDMWRQFFGTAEKNSHKESGVLEEGKPLELGKVKKSAEVKKGLNILPGLDYRADILYGSERLSKTESRELSSKVQEIMVELQRLVSSSAVLQAEFNEVAIQKSPVKVGKYHLNFFTWLLTVIRQARQKVEDSGSWLTAVSSKKKKRGYWNMFKKHGTTFGLSNERVVATQTG